MILNVCITDEMGTVCWLSYIESRRNIVLKDKPAQRSLSSEWNVLLYDMGVKTFLSRKKGLQIYYPRIID